MASNVDVKISADISDITAKLAVARAEFANTSGDLRKMAEQMRAAGAGASDELKSGLAKAAEAAAKARIEVNGLNKELREKSGGFLTGIKGQMEGALAPITSIRSALTGIAEAAAAAFAVEAVAHWAESVAEAGEHIGHLAQQTGMTVEEVSSLAGGMQAMGQNVDAAAGLIDKLEKNMIAAENGGKKQAAAFQAVGISAAELKNLSIEQVMDRIAEAFQRTADGPEKTAIALELMGRAGAEMIPFMDLGAKGMEEFRKRAEETGTVLTGPMVEGMERTQESFATLGLATQGLGTSLFELFKPAIDATVNGLIRFVEAINDSIRTGGTMAEVMKVLAAAVNGVIIAIRTISLGFQELWEIVATGARVASDILHGQFTQALADVQHGWENAKSHAVDYYQTVARLAENSGSDLGATGGEEGTKKPKLDASGLETGGGASSKSAEAMKAWKNQLDQMLLDQQIFGDQAKAYELEFWQQKLAVAKAGGKDMVEAAREITAQIYNLENAAAQAATQRSNEALRARFAEYRRLGQEEIAEVTRVSEALKQETETQFQNFKLNIDLQRDAARGNAEERLRLDEELIANAKELYGEDSAAFREAMRQKSADMRAAADEQMEPWKNVVQGIGSAFNTMFNGILSGTQSFQQMMRNVGQNILATMGNVAIQSAEKWILEEIRQTLFHRTMEAQQTASTVAGVAARSGVQASAAATENAGFLLRAARWIATELGMTAATTTAEATRTAEKTAASTATATETAIINVGLVESYAAVAAAGAAASVAAIPYVGWAMAPEVAAATFAGLQPYAAMAAFKEGTEYVPNTGVALVHQGERIIDSRSNEALTEALTGGARGGDVNFHLNYNASGGRDADHRTHAREIVEIIKHQIRIGGLKVT